jgi:2-keto-4-pentenoate hydratase/2-oxohepta-3-ene-1,7-dioic acid hydratase in catechol pathway
MNLLRTSLGVGVRTDSATIPFHTYLGIGRNYAEHAKEQGLAPPESILVFNKNPASAILSGEDIVVPKACQDPAKGGDQTDFEGELAVIIGTPARDVSQASALNYVLGYCAANDVSARWWQKQGAGGQFFRGKSFDTFCPLGPNFVPAAKVPDPQALRLVTRVNGKVMQEAPTSDMLFPVATLISELSRGLTILPGTVILTGTPGGVGMARTPPQWLQHGDTVEVAITAAAGSDPGFGVLTNRIRFEGR